MTALAQRAGRELFIIGTVGVLAPLGGVLSASGRLAFIAIFVGLEFTPEYRAAIATLQLHPVQARWGRDWDDEQLECVLREAQPLLRQLGYTR